MSFRCTESISGNCLLVTQGFQPQDCLTACDLAPDEDGNGYALNAEGWDGGPDDGTMVDLGGGMVVPLGEVLEDDQ